MKLSEIVKYKNAEFIQFFTRINRILSNYDLQKLQFKTESDLFKRLTNDLFGLYNLSQKQDLTLELARLDDKRGNAIRIIRKLIDAHTHNHQEDYRLAANKLLAVVTKYGPYIERLPYGEETLAVNKVIAEISSDEKLKQKTKLLGGTEYLNHLKATNEEFEHVYINRNRVEAGSEKKIFSLREELFLAFRAWAGILEAHAKISEDKNYKDLLAEIETFVIKSNRDFLLRISKIGEELVVEDNLLSNGEMIDEGSSDLFLDDRSDESIT